VQVADLSTSRGRGEFVLILSVRGVYMESSVTAHPNIDAQGIRQHVSNTKCVCNS